MIRLCLLVFLCFMFSANLFSQELTIINCLKGENGELLKGMEIITPDNYLFDIRSNSNTRDFIRLDSTGNNTNTWLFMLNASTDTIWKKKLPNTQNTYYTDYMPLFSGYWISRVSDYPFSIHTILGNEIILHYSYYDSLINTFDSLVGFQEARNNILDFGILNISDGSYKLEPFTIDTIIKTPADTTLSYSSYKVLKLNDSIYQLAVVYSKSRQFNFYSIESWAFLNIYTINIHTKKIKVLRYNAEYRQLVSSNNRFYTLEKNYPQNDELILNKIGINGAIETSNSLKVLDKIPELNFINTTSNGELLFGGRQEYIISQGYKGSGILYKVNPLDLSFVTQEINFHPDNSSSDYYIYPIVYKPNYLYYSDIFQPDNYGDASSTVTITRPTYCVIYESYHEDSMTINKNNIAKLDLEIGAISWVKSNKMKIIDVLADRDELIGTIDSSFTVPVYNTLHHNTVQKTDSSLQLIWETSLPDSIRINDSLVYYPYSGITNYFPVNYKNQFIVSVNYIDTSQSNMYYIKPFYFFISKINGSITQLKIQYELTPTDHYQFIKEIKFFTPSNDELIAIWQNENLCNATSNTDIAFYRYNELISGFQMYSSAKPIGFTLFPNPINSTLTIQFNSIQNIEDATMKIMDISGRIVYNTILKNEPQHTIDVHQFPDGMYFLQIDDAKELHQIKKFQVIH